MTWPQRTAFAALVAWLTAVVFMTATAWRFYGEDFRGYYAAARVVLAGGDPYDYRQVAPVLQAVTGRVGNNPYYYPPWFVAGVLPLAWLPFQAARAVWLALSAGAWVAGLIVAARALEWPASQALRGLWAWGAHWALFGLATFVFAWITWRFEQLGVWLFAFLAAAVWALRAGRDRWAGAWLALLLTKPTASAVFVAALLLWAARRGRREVWIGFGLALAGLLAVGSLAAPGWLTALGAPGFGRGLTEVLDGPDVVTSLRLNTTLLDWLKMLGWEGPAALAVYALAGAAALGAAGWAAWRAGSAGGAAAVAVVAHFWATPYALQYDFPPLTWALYWAVTGDNAPAGWRWRVGVGLLGLALASVPLWERPISDGFWIVIGLTVLLAWRWLNEGRHA